MQQCNAAHRDTRQDDARVDPRLTMMRAGAASGVTMTNREATGATVPRVALAVCLFPFSEAKRTFHECIHVAAADRRAAIHPQGCRENQARSFADGGKARS